MDGRVVVYQYTVLFYVDSCPIDRLASHRRRVIPSAVVPYRANIMGTWSILLTWGTIADSEVSASLHLPPRLTPYSFWVFLGLAS